MYMYPFSPKPSSYPIPSHLGDLNFNFSPTIDCDSPAANEISSFVLPVTPPIPHFSGYDSWVPRSFLIIILVRVWVTGPASGFELWYLSHDICNQGLECCGTDEAFCLLWRISQQNMHFLLFIYETVSVHRVSKQEMTLVTFPQYPSQSDNFKNNFQLLHCFSVLFQLFIFLLKYCHQ